MRRFFATGCVLLALSGCGSTTDTTQDGAFYQSSSASLTSSSTTKIVVPAGFPRRIGVDGDVLSGLLSASSTVRDPTIRAMLTKARETFSLTLTDGTYEFPRELHASGLTHATLRRDRVATGDLVGDVAKDVAAILEYKNNETVIASELLVFSFEHGKAELRASYVLRDASISAVGIANRTVIVRASVRGEATEMRFTPNM